MGNFLFNTTLGLCVYEMHHNYPHKGCVFCLKMLQASVNCHCEPLQQFTIRINGLFVSSLQKYRFWGVYCWLCEQLFSISVMTTFLLFMLTLSFVPPLSSITSETRGSVECNAADGFAGRGGVRDEVPHRNGLCPQTAGRTQGEGAARRRWNNITKCLHWEHPLWQFLPFFVCLGFFLRWSSFFQLWFYTYLPTEPVCQTAEANVHQNPLGGFFCNCLVSI